MWSGTKVLMLCAALATVALVAAPGAVASPPTAASGSFTYTSSTFNSVLSAGGNLIVDLSATVSYTGTFSGTSTVEGTLIIHADGSANFHDVETFTGTVNGVSGTVTFDLTGGNRPGFTDFHATDTIISASGGLAGLHGVLNWEGVALQMPNGPFGAYSGQIQSGQP
jgi:Protein of unknown function (DUF3224)